MQAFTPKGVQRGVQKWPFVRVTRGARNPKKDGRIVLLTTFRKQRNNERAEIERARKQAVADAASNP